MRNLHPAPEDKAAIYRELVESNSLLADRGARGPEADAQAWPGSAPGVSPGAAAALADGVRPWHHSMATQQVAPQDEEAARRRFAAEVAAENLRMVREREMQRRAEQEARRQPVQDEWYSRGDTHRYSPSHEQGLRSSTGWSPGAGPRPASASPPWAMHEPQQQQQQQHTQHTYGPTQHTHHTYMAQTVSAQPLEKPAYGQDQRREPWEEQQQQLAYGRPQWQEPVACEPQPPPWPQQQQLQAPAQAVLQPPWATSGDGMAEVRPRTAQVQPKQQPYDSTGAGRLPERQYPWTWQA